MCSRNGAVTYSEAGNSAGDKESGAKMKVIIMLNRKASVNVRLGSSSALHGFFFNGYSSYIGFFLNDV